jgi:hypothetical protein
VVLRGSVAGILALGLFGLAACGPEEPARAGLAFVSDPENEHFGTVLLMGAPPSRDWPLVFTVRVKSAETDAPPVLGSYFVEADSVRFRPRFAFTAGLAYRARFEDAEITFTMPERVSEERPRVEAVYPSSTEVPENLLRLYVHFSHPMRAKDVPERVHLYDSEGREVPLPFVEIDTGLWDSEGKRLTLFFHPGRVKRGVGPNLALGPPLRAGGLYRLVVDGAMKDQRGYELEASFEKKLRVGPPDRTSPDPSSWSLLPVVSSLEVVLDEPLDRALLLRLIRVTRDRGAEVLGVASTRASETRFSFTPNEPWSPGTYHLVVDPEIEDLAGNKPGRLFDAEIGQAQSSGGAVALSFEVR